MHHSSVASSPPDFKLQMDQSSIVAYSCSMAISRRRRPNRERVRAAQLEGCRARLRDLTHHRPDLSDDERGRLVAETEARIAELEDGPGQ